MTPAIAALLTSLGFTFHKAKPSLQLPAYWTTTVSDDHHSVEVCYYPDEMKCRLEYGDTNLRTFKVAAHQEMVERSEEFCDAALEKLQDWADESEDVEIGDPNDDRNERFDYSEDIWNEA